MARSYLMIVLISLVIAVWFCPAPCSGYLVSVVFPLLPPHATYMTTVAVTNRIQCGHACARTSGCEHIQVKENKIKGFECLLYRLLPTTAIPPTGVYSSCSEALKGNAISEGLFEIRPIKANPNRAVLKLPCTTQFGNYSALLSLESHGGYEWNATNQGVFSVEYNNTDEELRMVIANSRSCRQHIAIKCLRSGVSWWRSFDRSGPMIRYYPKTTDPANQCSCSGTEDCCCDDDLSTDELPDCDYHNSYITDPARTKKDYGYLSKTADLPVKTFKTYSDTSAYSRLRLGPLQCDF